MPRFDATTIGEGQLRLSVPAGTRLEKTYQLTVNAAGTEGNVTSLLSRLGWNCGWVSSLPKGPLGRRVVREYSTAGLDISAVVWRDSGRLATYYVEYANPPRSTQVIYDRKNSCFANLTVDDIDWDYLLDTRLLHLSGITIALSDSMREILLEAIRRAKAKGVKVSFDMNYRSLLWTPEEAAEGVKPVFEAVDVLFLARGDAQRMFGFEGTSQEIVEQIASLTSASHIVTSLGSDGLIGWDREEFYHQPAREVGILDRIGAGDAMVGGVLHGWLQNDFAKAIRYGVLTAALALSQWGEQIVTNFDEVESLLDANGTDISR
jgi:2-dehydro-3-deoxygluconokinase